MNPCKNQDVRSVNMCIEIQFYSLFLLGDGGNFRTTKRKKGKEMNIWGFTVFSALEHFVNIC